MMSINEVLQQTDGGKDFFSFVMGEDIRKNKHYKNPFDPNDTKPGVSFYPKDGRWLYHDFGDDTYQGDVFTFAGEYYNYPTITHLDEIIKKMAGDLHLNNGGVVSAKTSTNFPEKVNFEVAADIEDYSYWLQFVAEKQLKDVLKKHPFRSWKWFEKTNEDSGKKWKIYAKPGSPIFAFELIKDKLYKIYQPTAPKGFKQTWYPRDAKPEGSYNVFGIDQLPDKCEQVLVVEGPKDMIVASAHGYNAVALDHAGSMPSPKEIESIKQRTNSIILLLDNDQSGTEAARKLSGLHQWPYLILPESFNIGSTKFESWGTDIADYFQTAKKHGLELPFEDYLTNNLQDPEQPQPKEESNPGTGKIAFIKSYISQHYNIRFNEMTNDYELDEKPIDDRDLNSIYLAIAVSYKKANPKTKSYISKAMTQDIIESEFTESYNPLREFLEANQDRGCEGTIGKLAAAIDSKTVFPESVGISTPYVEYFLTKWLVNLIATALDGTDNPLLLALLGEMNTGKTEFLRRLLPQPLKKYYAEHSIADDKDFYIAMSKNMLISDDELSGKSKVETKALNKIMSKQNINIRVPYGRKEMKLTRRASLAGTGNDLRVLFDINGNRRIIPVEVISINHKAYNAIDKIDLIVEAWKLYVQGYNYRLTGSDISALNDSTFEFQYNELEVEVIQEYLIKGTKERHEYKTNSGIKTLIESNTKHRISPMKLGKALTHLGFERVKRKVHKKSMWVYAIHPDSKIIILKNEAEQDDENKRW